MNVPLLFVFFYLLVVLSFVLLLTPLALLLLLPRAVSVVISSHIIKHSLVFVVLCNAGMIDIAVT